jgi:hypothetical protein
MHSSHCICCHVSEDRTFDALLTFEKELVLFVPSQHTQENTMKQVTVTSFPIFSNSIHSASFHIDTTTYS